MRSQISGLTAGLLLALTAVAGAAPVPPMRPDIPAEFTPPTADFDYVKRDVMIPMRDGVKLHTVIVIPKGAQRAPIILTRTPYNARARPSACEPAHARRRWPMPMRCSWPTGTSASTRTCAASTARKATT